VSTPAHHTFCKLCLTMVVTLIVMTTSAMGGEAPKGAGLSVSNEFVRIRVNPGPDEAGRFAVDTTGGDPSRSSDDNQVLIYGSSDPWTSYTTVLLDGKPIVFGGPTSRRAGRGGPAGEMVVSPHITDGTVTCTIRLGDLEVMQQLGLTRSPTTRVKDAALIAYRVTNRGGSPHEVGLRVVLDTMLGANDGAPLRAGDRAVTSATSLKGDEIPDYWQAFDSLSRPAVISQGTLRASGLTPPDRLEMVDWGTLADAPWDYPFPEGADFTRQGEEEQDSAVALYWRPLPLGPGESRSYVTLYGVGGVTLSPAQLTLGLTAPAEVDYQYEDTRPFSVVAYLENSGGFEARGTTVSLALGKGLALAEGQPKSGLGAVRPGETKQVSWKVRPTGESTGPLRIAALATSENLEPNRVEREVVVNSPPQLELALSAPARLRVTTQNRYWPNPFELRATAANVGAQAGRSLVAVVLLPDGLKLVEGAPATQVKEGVEPGQTESFTWAVHATGMPTGELPISVRVTAAGAKPVEAGCTVRVPWLTPELRVYPADQTVPLVTDNQPTLVPIAVKVAPARELLGARLSIRYDPTVLELLYVSRGDAFVDSGRLLSPWSAGRAEPGYIADVGGRREEAPLLSAPEVTLFTVVFMAKAPGASDLFLESASLLGPDGREVDHRILAGRVEVRSTEVNR
jgi:hypothetical protein